MIRVTAIPQTSDTGSPGRPRSAFTLVEILLAIGVVSIILLIAWPNVLRLSSRQSLIDSADKVRALAASARVQAIESGLVYQFRYEPGGRHFVVLPFEREFESVSATTSAGKETGRYSKASGQLPEGVIFEAPTLLKPSSTGETSAGPGQSLSSEALEGLPDASTLESVGWSGPVLFQPDGSAADATLALIDQRNQRISIRVRGVTGAVSASRVLVGERP